MKGTASSAEGGEAGDVTPVGVIDAAEALVFLNGVNAGAASMNSSMIPSQMGGVPADAGPRAAHHVLPPLNPSLPAPFPPRAAMYSITPQVLEQRLVPPPLPQSASPALALYHASAASLCSVRFQAVCSTPVSPGPGAASSCATTQSFSHQLPFCGAGGGPFPSARQTMMTTGTERLQHLDDANSLLSKWVDRGHVSHVQQRKRVKL